MTPFNNFKIAAVLVVFVFVEAWPTVIAQRGNVGEAGEHVRFGQCQRGLTNTLGLASNRGTQLGKESPFNLDDLFLGIENLGLVLFQFWSCEAFGVDQGLFAFIVGRRKVKVSLRNLDVVAKDRIELYLERSDSSAFAFALLDASQILLGIAAQVAKLVQIFVNGCGDHAALVQGERWFGNECVVDFFA